jgi:hypothetical protein
MNLINKSIIKILFFIILIILMFLDSFKQILFNNFVIYKIIKFICIVIIILFIYDFLNKKNIKKY